MYIKSIHDIIKSYDNFIVDVWGVIHNGHELFPNVIDTLKEIKKLNKHVIFLSNAPRRAHELASDLERFGIMSDLYHDIHTSGEDAYEHLSMRGNNHYKGLDNKCYVFLVSSGHAQMIDDCQLERVGSLDNASFMLNLQPPRDGSITNDDYEKLLQEALKKDLPMVCVNPDFGVVKGNKVHQCAGTLAQHYESLGGVVHYHGKPFESVYNSALNKFPTQDKSRTLAIGDSLRTDIKGASDFGVDSILVLSGLDAYHDNEKTLDQKAEEFLKNSILRPTYVCAEFR